MGGVDSVRSSIGELDRMAAARDLWPGGTLDTWQGRAAPRPERVFWPETEAQVHAVLEEAARRGIAVVPYGAGSGVCGGARGREGAWVLDTKALDAIGPLDTERWTVIAGAGVNGQQLEDWLAARGFTLGHSPSSISCSTVGGWAAARSAGQFSSKYGVFEDMVLALRAVSPARGPFSVGLGGDAPGAWMDLLLGSEGTLAVVTEVTMRVRPVPVTRWFRGYRMPDVATGLRAMRELMQGELHPSVVRLYDPVDTRIGGKTQPKRSGGSGGLRRLRGIVAPLDRIAAVRSRSLALPLALPGLVNRIFDRIASGCLLIVGFEGDPEVVDVVAAQGHAALCALGEDLGSEPGERWFSSRHAVSYKLMPIFERGGFADTMEVAARWSDLETTYHGVRRALSQTAVVMAHMSHVYPEGGCIYFSFAGRGDRETYQRTWDAALRAVLDAGATTTHHHGVGSLKMDAASTEVGPGIEAWRALKRELDPAAVMNPGRLYREVPYEDPGPAPALRPEDQLARSSVHAPPPVGVEPLWPFAELAGAERWYRESWQNAWVEVAGTVAGRRCLVGRGPRSASGPDVRRFVASQPDATATFALAPPGSRVMLAVTCARPWAVARSLLRSDLRPAVLTVRGGALHIGFRGPAAKALAEVARRRVTTSGATEVDEIPYEAAPLPVGAFEVTTDDDPAATHVTCSYAFRRPS